MKELHRTEGYAIGVLNELNYYTGKPFVAKDKEGNDKGEEIADMRYHSRLEDALEYVARSVARDKCTDLADYCVIIRESIAGMREAMAV